MLCVIIISIISIIFIIVIIIIIIIVISHCYIRALERERGGAQPAGCAAQMGRPCAARRACVCYDILHIRYITRIL